MKEEATQQTFKCFVVMPFSETEYLDGGNVVKISSEEWDYIFESWIKRAVESFKPHKFRCFRSPSQPGNFIKGIVKDLYDSDIIIADLTGGKANVYYELGIRHALETGTIMITQYLASVPSDLRGYYTFQYIYTNQHHQYSKNYNEFEKHLHEKIAYIFDNLNPSDNPVSDFLGHKNEYLQQTFENERNELLFLAELLKDAIEHNSKVCKAILRFRDGGEIEEGGAAPFFDPYPFDLMLSRVVNTRWSLMPSQTLIEFNELIQTFRRLFLPIQQLWTIHCVHPNTEVTGNIFELIEEATTFLESAQGEALNALVESISLISYSITYSPKSNQ